MPKLIDAFRTGKGLGCTSTTMNYFMVRSDFPSRLRRASVKEWIPALHGVDARLKRWREKCGRGMRARRVDTVNGRNPIQNPHSSVLIIMMVRSRPRGNARAMLAWPTA